MTTIYKVDDGDIEAIGTTEASYENEVPEVDWRESTIVVAESEGEALALVDQFAADELEPGNVPMATGGVIYALGKISRGRGRPALPPDQRRKKRGVNLPPETWEKLARLAEAASEDQNRTLERLITESPEPR